MYAKVLSNIQEIKARHGKIITVATDGDREAPVYSDYVMTIPPIDEELSCITSVVPLQLFAYYVAALNGKDIDKPRNLAKSVTVE